MCRAVFEIPALIAPIPAAPALAPVVDAGKGRGKASKGKGKGKKAATVPVTLPATISATSLPANLFAASVLSVLAASSFSSAAKVVNPNEIKCEICEDGEEDATVFCAQCSQYLCAGCQRGHKRQKGTTFHELLSVDQALKGKMKTSVVHCEKHSHLEINTYCHTDKRAICAECVVDSHVGHQFERLVNMVQGFKEEILTRVKQVSFFFSFLFLSLKFLLLIDFLLSW